MEKTKKCFNPFKMMILLVTTTIAGVIFSYTALAEKEVLYTITIKNHQFVPEELAIPAHKKVKLVIENQDATPEEFESYDLNREKVVKGNGKVILYLGPLKPGKYRYFGDFHPKTAQGIIVVKKETETKKEGK